MNTAEQEHPRAGAGANFSDAVALDFCDAQHDLFGLARLTRLPNAGGSRASVALFNSGELVERLELESDAGIDDWSEARLDGVRMHAVRPLEHWVVEIESPRLGLRLDAEALSRPRALPDGMPAGVGFEQYEQLCGVSGSIDLDGRIYPVRCLGRRVHRWGELPWDRIDRWRALYAATGDGRAISVIAALPAGSKGHDAELRAAHHLDHEQPEAFEDARLSTVYGEDGLPAKVGLELWTVDDEFPRRFGGEALCGTREERGDHDLSVSFFRWLIEGEPAYGCYELARRR
jgi:hypothetical protein